jgi:pimeloyl-ACP methyl ester carboxylesterase
MMPSHNGAVVMITHGYNGNRGDCLEQAAFLVNQGYGVLLFDLLAHGQSEGNTLSLNGRDVLAAVRFLKENPESRSLAIGAWGFSLGAMSEIQAAAQTPAILGIVADGPFPVVSIEDMPKPATLGDWFWEPFNLVEYQAWEFQGVVGAMNVPDALGRIAPRPVLIISGTQNQGEYRTMREYYFNAGQNVSLWEVPEAGHIGSWSARELDYEARVLAFFAKILLK